MTVYVKKKIDRLKTGEPVHPISIKRVDQLLENNVDRLITHLNTEVANLNGDKNQQFEVADSEAPTDASQAQDHTTNENTGTLNGDPTWVKDGPNEDMRGSLSFDGVDDYVDVGDVDIFDFTGSQTFTIEGWIRTTDKSDIQNSFLDKKSGSLSSGTVGGYAIWWDDVGTVDVKLVDSVDSGTGLSGSTDIADGEWHHIALSVDILNEPVYLYIDGETEHNTPRTSDDLTTIYPLQFNNVDWPSDAEFSDIRIWNHARTLQQIRDNMNKRLGGNEAGLIGYWPLNDRLTLDYALNQGVANDTFATDNSLRSHVEDTTNPHNVTKAQVGLGIVTNDKQLKKTEFDAHVNSNEQHGLSPTSQLNASNEPDAIARNNEIVQYLAIHEPGATTRMRARIGRAKHMFMQTYDYYSSNDNDTYPTFVMFDYHSTQPVIFSESVVSSWFEPRNMGWFQSMQSVRLLGSDMDYQGRTFILLNVIDNSDDEYPVLLTMDRYNDLYPHQITDTSLAGLKNVVALASDNSGNIAFVTNTNKVGYLTVDIDNKLTYGGIFNTAIDSTNNEVLNVAVDQNQNMYVIVNGRLLKMNYQGEIENEVSAGILDLAITQDGQHIYTRQGNEQIVKYDADFVSVWTKNINSIQAVRNGGSMAVNDDDELFLLYLTAVNDINGDNGQYKKQTYRVMKLNPEGGTITTSDDEFTVDELLDQGYKPYPDTYEYMKMDIDMVSNVYLFHASSTGESGSEGYKMVKLNSDLEYETEKLKYFSKSSLSQTDLNTAFADFGTIISAVVEPGKVGAGHWTKAP